ncbi:hypothetical protein HQ584_09190 [Patescibacteria group bacterium]|nr:hypothetical protein [Patescibacteria group bacterium]
MAKAAEERGHAQPKLVKEKPVLNYCQNWYYRSFTELSTCRDVGMGEGPIPWTAIDRFCIRYGITEFWEFDDFVYIIRKIDNEYLKLRADKNANRTDKHSNQREGRKGSQEKH